MNPSRICENCGKIYRGEICPKCGEHYEYQRLNKEEREQKYQEKKEKRNKINEEYGFTNDEIFMMYHEEAKQADKVYKSFVTDGVSRIEKVNGRFLAAQLIKLDVLNQQNNRIIQQNDEIILLLKKIAEK